MDDETRMAVAALARGQQELREARVALARAALTQEILLHALAALVLRTRPAPELSAEWLRERVATVVLDLPGGAALMPEIRAMLDRALEIARESPPPSP